MLQAAEEGLGTCWLGWFDESAVRKALGLPRGAKVDIIIALGYAAQLTPVSPSPPRLLLIAPALRIHPSDAAPLGVAR